MQLPVSGKNWKLLDLGLKRPFWRPSKLHTASAGLRRAPRSDQKHSSAQPETSKGDRANALRHVHDTFTWWYTCTAGDIAFWIRPLVGPSGFLCGVLCFFCCSIESLTKSQSWTIQNSLPWKLDAATPSKHRSIAWHWACHCQSCRSFQNRLLRWGELQP